MQTCCLRYSGQDIIRREARGATLLSFNAAAFYSVQDQTHSHGQNHIDSDGNPLKKRVAGESSGERTHSSPPCFAKLLQAINRSSAAGCRTENPATNNHFEIFTKSRPPGTLQKLYGRGNELPRPTRVHFLIGSCNQTSGINERRSRLCHLPLSAFQ